MIFTEIEQPAKNTKIGAMTPLAAVPSRKHVIRMCTGEACQVRSSAGLLQVVKERLERENQAAAGSDSRFVLKLEPCLGACGMSPVMIADNEAYCRVTVDKALQLIEMISQEKSPGLSGDC